MQVVKRDYRVVRFNKDKIINAIHNAMLETKIGIDTELSNSIANKIYSIQENLSVEEIQDYVETYLMESNRKDVAKQYILYRNQRGKTRKNKKLGILSEEFLSTYKHKPSPMKQLGSFVYYRTYSRYLPEENRREYWWETVKRAVEYNCSLAQTSKEEAEQLFDNIYNLKQFLSGRTLYIGGTLVSEKFPTSNYNCSFTVIDNFEAFKDAFYLLMIGSGFGFRTLKEDVIKLPKVKTSLEVIHKDYTPVPRNKREDNTSIQFVNNNMVKIIVGDSKGGWVQALDYFLRMLWDKDFIDVKNIIFVYDNVRPKGERLKTFGGTASGHESLKAMFAKVDKIIKKEGLRQDLEKIKLKPINCIDILNAIGENVVIGGVRRTSEIALIGADDTECIKAKSNLYKQSSNGKWEIDSELSHRQMSNNSIYYKEKPSREQIHWQIEQMRYSGEPAFVNEIAGSKRRTNFNGVNPCFTGDMNLLTAEGYKTFEELDGKEVKVINMNGDISDGKVWCSGEKDVVEVKLSNGKNIKCTPNHILMLKNGEECEAKNCLSKKLQTFQDMNTTVVSIEKLGKKKVYDFSEPLTHWGVVENVIVHNCAEILLDANGLCNLTTVNVFAFVKDGKLDVNDLLQAQKLSARSGYRMTCVELELPKWNMVQQRDRLIGCSLTGWQDMVNSTNMSKMEEADLLKSLRQTAHNEADRYAKDLGLPFSLLMTTVKPEGTLSQLPTVSSGVHYSHSPYFIRRVRINAHDPLVKVCEELSYPIFPEVGQELETCTTKVIEFPVKSPIGRTKFDVSAIEQLEDYKMFMDNYVDHNASITITVRDNEWEAVEEWVFNNWNDIVAVSFLSLSDSFYQLMPYESITEEEYNKRVSEMNPFIPSLISKYEEVETEFDIGNDGCESGVCPVR